MADCVPVKYRFGVESRAHSNQLVVLNIKVNCGTSLHVRLLKVSPSIIRTLASAHHTASDTAALAVDHAVTCDLVQIKSS